MKLQTKMRNQSIDSDLTTHCTNLDSVSDTLLLIIKSLQLNNPEPHRSNSMPQCGSFCLNVTEKYNISSFP